MSKVSVSDEAFSKVFLSVSKIAASSIAGSEVIFLGLIVSNTAEVTISADLEESTSIVSFETAASIICTDVIRDDVSTSTDVIVLFLNL